MSVRKVAELQNEIGRARKIALKGGAAERPIAPMHRAYDVLMRVGSKLSRRRATPHPEREMQERPGAQPHILDDSEQHRHFGSQINREVEFLVDAKQSRRIFAQAH